MKIPITATAAYNRYNQKQPNSQMPANRFSKIATAFLLFGAIQSVFAAQSLNQVYQLAVQNDPEYRGAIAIYEAGKQEQRLASSALKPQIIASYNYSQTDADTLSEFPFSFDDNDPATTNERVISNRQDNTATTNMWGVSLSQTLFSASQWQNAKAGKQRSEAAYYQYLSEQQNLIIRVTSAYINVLKATNNNEAAEAQLAADESQLAQAQERFDLGAIAKTDLLQAQAAYDFSKASLLGSQAQLSNAKRNLTIVTGTPTNDLQILNDNFTASAPAPNDAISWQQTAGQQNPQVKIAEANRDEAKANANSAKGSRLPTVEASLGYNDSSTDTDDDTFGEYTNETQGTSIGINVSLPLYLGGELSARKRQAQAKYNARIEAYAGTVRRAEQQTLSAYNDVLIDIASIEARRLAKDSAKSALDSIQLGYELGSRSITDLLGAQRAYYASVRDHGNAKLDYILNSFELKQLVGSLTAKDIADISDVFDSSTN